MAAYAIFLKITLFSYFWQLFSNKSLMAGAGGEHYNPSFLIVFKRKSNL